MKILSTFLALFFFVSACEQSKASNASPVAQHLDTWLKPFESMDTGFVKYNVGALVQARLRYKGYSVHEENSVLVMHLEFDYTYRGRNYLPPNNIVVFATGTATQYPNPRIHKMWKMHQADKVIHPNQPALVYISIKCEDILKMVVADGKLMFVSGMRGNLPEIMYQQVLNKTNTNLQLSDFKSLL